MSFEFFIQKICAGVSDTAEKQLRRSAVEFSRGIARSIADNAWEEGYCHDADRAIEMCSSISRYAAICDAVEIVSEKTFRTKLAEIFDIRIDWEAARTIKHLQGLLDRREIPSRGFVYVVWCSRTEQVIDVGEALSFQEFDFRSVMNACGQRADATDLALVFPSSSRPDVLSAVVDGLAEIFGFLQPAFLAEYGETNRVDSRSAGDVVQEIRKLLFSAAEGLGVEEPAQ